MERVSYRIVWVGRLGKVVVLDDEPIVLADPRWTREEVELAVSRSA